MDEQKVFSDAIEYVLSNEGGYVDNPSDPGGATNFGISLRFYREYYTAEATEKIIQELTKDDAIKIYRMHFWNDSYLQIISQVMINRVFDTAVNCGIANAHKILQRSVWACAGNKTCLADDGVIGPDTINHVNYFGVNLLFPFRAERAAHYKALVDKNVDLAKFLDGWLDRAYR